MSSTDVPSRPALPGLEEVRENWGWFTALGAIVVLLGTVAVGRAGFMTVLSVAFFGWIVLVGGVVEVVHAFWRKQWSGFLVDLLAGLLHLVVGLLIVAQPGVAAVALTLPIALLLIFGGVFRVVAAITKPLPNRLWLGVHGVVNLLLGISIWSKWPVSGLWVIGLFIGIEMIFNGWTLVMLGLALKSLPRADSAASTGESSSS